MDIRRSLFALAAPLVMAATTASAGGAPAPTPEARAASEKVIQALQHDTAIHAYQWTETMVVMVDGKEKESVVNACSYNAEGKVARSPETTRAASAKGVPGTKAELDSYLKSAVALMREYVRPDPAKLEACQQAGHVTVAVQEPGRRVKLDFKDYSKPGDDLALIVNPGTNQIVSLAASTYMVNAVDRAEIHTEMSQLPDGTGYPSRIQFDTPGRQLGVNVTNSDYRKKTS